MLLTVQGPGIEDSRAILRMEIRGRTGMLRVARVRRAVLKVVRYNATNN